MDKQDEKLKEVQDRLYQMALVFKEICDRHKLQYFMAYGTLLGAVRHGDFIPWDDDMDFVMPRPDYEKFIQVAAQEIDELSGGRYAIRDFTLEGVTYKKTWARIDDTSTSFEPSRDGITLDGYVGGVWIDIQPLDGTFNACLLQALHTRIIDKIQTLRWYTIFRDPSKTSNWKNKIGLKMVHRFLGGIFGHVLLHWIMKVKSYKKSKYVKHLSWDDKGILPKDIFASAVPIKIRDSEFFAPVKWHEYLTHFYGDYMTPVQGEGHYNGNEMKLNKSYIPRLEKVRTKMESIT